MMAWNEPGGGDKGDKDKDPWGNRDDQGPPDLDEAFRKLQSNLSEMFGGRGGGSGGGGGSRTPAISLNLIWWALGALIIIWFVKGVYQIDQQERGVVLRFGELQEGIVMPGLHWNPPLIDDVLKENATQVRSVTHNAEMLTEDENIVKVNMSVQYVISDIKAFLLNVRNPALSLKESMESALRHEVGSAVMNDVLTEGRVVLGLNVKDRIQLLMERYGTGIEVTQVNIDDTAPPDAVKAAFDDVIKAREDETRFANQANAYANQIIPEARGQAQRLLEEADAYRQSKIAESGGEAERFNKLVTEYKLAPEVTRERMYLDTMESVMSNSTKVMIDVEGGNNLLYLPLDKIMEASSSDRPVSSGSGYTSSGSRDSSLDRTTSNSGRPTSRRSER
jgi:membrane protease subunit HflK